MNSSNPLAAVMLAQAESAARSLGVTIVTLNARSTEELPGTLGILRQSNQEALLVSPDILFLSHAADVRAAVRKARLPGMFPFREYHGPGVLMSYGPNLEEASQHAAIYVDKILKGAKPAELPIEQIARYQLVIDLGVARELGIKVPQEVLLRADEVIR
jgi:putative ABC transport system substrate-binding protein